MVVCELKCQICGTQFQTEILDDEDPRERDRSGSRVCCPKCRSPEIEKVRILQRKKPR